MKIVGINQQTATNIAVVVTTAAIALALKEPLAILGLMMIQPAPINAVPESTEEYLSMNGVEMEEGESAIGFHAQL